jgi:outer membrane lipoprotein-sorting protein
MKKIFCLFSTLLLAAAFIGAQNTQAQSAVSIMEASRNRIDVQTTMTRSRMVIAAKNGTTAERVIDQYSKDGPHGERSVIVFVRPANVANTRFLMLDNANGDTDQWIFLPSLGKVRRIAASESGGNFMGTDMSYDDMASMSRELDKDTHTLLREEIYNGAACFVIQSVPHDLADYQYSRTVSWIDKETYVVHKTEMYDKRGVLTKIMEASELKEVSGYLTPTVTKISTVSAGTSTTVYMDIIKYNDPIPESVFTTTYLETGRAR